ncbi:Uncharacterized protein APZ42_031091 [Daphnia magna]|uniref:Uncharacterized protein n=1 Tax=Daphnia magna TaxID=35525 RepID=A0A164N5C0_9CRUS|nr:Uncharacterized protein APZ42_031091 [Daphnia magna]
MHLHRYHPELFQQASTSVDEINLNSESNNSSENIDHNPICGDQFQDAGQNVHEDAKQHVQYPTQKSEHRFNFLKPPIGGVLRFKASNRSENDHDEQCAALEHEELRTHYSRLYGINQISILSSFLYFHVIGGLVPDIMHDILEGVLPLTLMFKKEISESEVLDFELLVGEYLSAFKECWPSRQFIPKMHHLVHYPRHQQWMASKIKSDSPHKLFCFEKRIPLHPKMLSLTSLSYPWITVGTVKFIANKSVVVFKLLGEKFYFGY